MASTAVELLRRRFGGGVAGDSYTLLESIANGTIGGQCGQISTGLIPNDANWVFSGSYRRIGAMTANYASIISAYTSETINSYRIIRAGASDSNIYCNGWSRASLPSQLNSKLSLNTKYTYTLSYGILVLNGQTNNLNTTQGSGNQTSELKLCNLNFPQRITEFTAYHNGVLVADMIPCKRLSDNVCGMYDIVRRQFFTSSNQYNFTE